MDICSTFSSIAECLSYCLSYLSFCSRAIFLRVLLPPSELYPDKYSGFFTGDKTRATSITLLLIFFTDYGTFINVCGGDAINYITGTFTGGSYFAENLDGYGAYYGFATGLYELSLGDQLGSTPVCSTFF